MHQAHDGGQLSRRHRSTPAVVDISRQEASLFFRLVSDRTAAARAPSGSNRWRRDGSLITTTRRIRGGTRLLAGDEVAAIAIPDHLLHRARLLPITGRSYRLRDLEDARKT